MFKLYYAEKLQALEMERLTRNLPRRVAVEEQTASRSGDETRFLGAVVRRLKALTLRSVATNVTRDVRDSARKSACSGESGS